MKKILAFILMAAILAVPAMASGEPAASSEPAPAAEAPAAAVQDTAANRVTVEVTVEATCVDKGLLTYTYPDGQTMEVETVPTGQHDYVATVTEATCTEDGVTTYTCSVCGDTYTEVIPAAGHTPSAPAATCTEAVICTVCGETLEPATGHAYTYQYDADQNEDGSFATFGTWACDNCGDILDATEGNAVYYYGQRDAGASDEAPPEEAAAPEVSNPDYDPDAHNWGTIEGVMAIVIIVVLAVLMLSFGKGTPVAPKKED